MLARIETPMINNATATMDFNTPRKWYALLTIANKEQAAADWIRVRSPGTWIYWPNITSLVPHGHGRRRSQLKAIIPGYLFMGEVLTAGDPWPIVHDTPGVRSFVRNATGHAATLRESDIEIIRKIEGDENLPQDRKTAHRFKTGDKVRFIADLLGAWPPGIVTRLADDGRIVVNVSLLGRMVPVQVEPHQIKAM